MRRRICILLDKLDAVKETEEIIKTTVLSLSLKHKHARTYTCINAYCIQSYIVRHLAHCCCCCIMNLNVETPSHSTRSASRSRSRDRCWSDLIPCRQSGKGLTNFVNTNARKVSHSTSIRPTMALLLLVIPAHLPDHITVWMGGHYDPLVGSRHSF